MLIGDKASDSDPLDTSLRGRGVEMVAPHKNNRPKQATQDGRRLVVRWEYYAENYLGFALLACGQMSLKYL